MCDCRTFILSLSVSLFSTPKDPSLPLGSAGMHPGEGHSPTKGSIFQVSLLINSGYH